MLVRRVAALVAVSIATCGATGAAAYKLVLDNAYWFSASGSRISWRDLTLGARLEEVEALYGPRASWLMGGSCYGVTYHLIREGRTAVVGFTMDDRGPYLSSISVAVSGASAGEPEPDSEIFRWLNPIKTVVKERLGVLLYVPSLSRPTQSENEDHAPAYRWAARPDVEVSLNVHWVTITLLAERARGPIKLPE